MTATLEVTPIESVKPIDVSKIDPAANYTCRLQIGARQNWRKFRGGKVTTKQHDNSKQIEVTHTPAVHMTNSIKGETVLGLVTAHNRWLEDNRTRATLHGTDSTTERSKSLRPVQDDQGPVFKGDVARQLLVTHFEETDEPSEDTRFYRNPVEMLRHAIADAAKDIVAAARNEDTKTTRSKKSTS